MPRRLTKEEFIERAVAAHGTQYDYSHVKYKNNSTKVVIGCFEHGIFLQKPATHILSKYGCPKCSNVKLHQKLLKNTKKVMEQAKKIHKEFYDYSKVVYRGKHHKIEIICPIHGSFKQIAKDHLNGSGCPTCTGRKKLTTKKFIEKARQVHGITYDYSLIKYVNNKCKVKIICRKHGMWLQRPNDHLSGYGCPSCCESKGEQLIVKWLVQHNIAYKQQHTFSDCKYRTQLRFDFWLPKHNICIEYDGQQHFEPIKVWGGKKAFEIGQRRDKIKNQYCKQNKISLLRISYKQFKKIEHILQEFILKKVLK